MVMSLKRALNARDCLTQFRSIFPIAHGLRNEITIVSESAPEGMAFTRSCASMRLSGQYRSRSAAVKLTREYFRFWIPL